MRHKLLRNDHRVLEEKDCDWITSLTFWLRECVFVCVCMCVYQVQDKKASVTIKEICIVEMKPPVLQLEQLKSFLCRN